MELPPAGTLVLLTVISFLAAVLALAVAHVFFSGRRRGAAHLLLVGLETPQRYIFRDGYLISEIEDEDCFIADPSDRARAWTALIDGLTPLNAEIGPAMEALRRRGEGFILLGHVGPDTLSVAGRAEDETLIITVATSDERNSRQAIHKDSLDAFRSEMEDLRASLDHSPVAMWKEDADGRITWASAAYLRLLERLTGAEDGLVWPLDRVFADQLDPPPEAGTLRRCQIDLSHPEGPAWFDVSATRATDGMIYAANPVDRLVAAEVALRNFVQTLSKTFAHLPIGLAIFDKRRELVLFNPALVTLSTLDPDWLSTRPSLFSFLDQLREHQRMPEPKNYKAWRQSISELEQAAQDGSYQELWTLPTGQTYRVIGRPHPDGAVAFMFEDISSEVSLTRQFRADLDLYQSVLDEVEAAIAVFSGDGQLVLSNQAYADLWDSDPREMLGTMGLMEATRLWQDRALPSPVWGDIRTFATQYAERAAWSEQVQLSDGGTLECRISPLKRGAMLVAFRRIGAAEPAEAGDAAAPTEPLRAGPD